MSSLFPEQSQASEEHYTGVPVPEEDNQMEEQAVPLSSPIVLSPEAQLPPEAQGETNGGPLGCCLGTVVGLLLTFLLITTVSIALANGGFLGFATIPVLVLGTILGGYFGWRVGKRLYREYDPPIVKRRKPFMKKG
jgi:hypothetical protein